MNFSVASGSPPMPEWKIILTRTAATQLERLDAEIKLRLRKYLHERLAVTDDPRRLGKYLVDSDGLYRFRVGAYRLITSIDNGAITIYVLKIGHRSAIYKAR
jgi:mRNA interferase RelE/StbE